MRMVNIDLAREMIAKVNPDPFYFGGDNKSYFWRVVEVDGIIYGELAQSIKNEAKETYYSCLACDKNSRQLIYDDMLIDFCVYYADGLRSGTEREIFGEMAGGPNDSGLNFILSVLGKTYDDFLRDAFFWYSVVLLTEPADDGSMKIKHSALSDDARVAKKIIDRSERSPICIVNNDSATDYFWWLCESSGKIWYLRSTHRHHDEYIFISDEYGCVSLRDTDAMNALRDAIRSPFLFGDAEVLETDTDIGEVLALVGLSLDEIE